MENKDKKKRKPVSLNPLYWIIAVSIFALGTLILFKTMFGLSNYLSQDPSAREYAGRNHHRGDGITIFLAEAGAYNPDKSPTQSGQAHLSSRVSAEGIELLCVSVSTNSEYMGQAHANINVEDVPEDNGYKALEAFQNAQSDRLLDSCMLYDSYWGDSAEKDALRAVNLHRMLKAGVPPKIAYFLTI